MTALLEFRDGAALVLERKKRARMTPEQREELRLLRDWACRDWCEEHQRRHRHTERRAAVATLLPLDSAELHDAVNERWPCYYGDTSNVDGAAAQKLRRDLRAAGARLDKASGLWRLR